MQVRIYSHDEGILWHRSANEFAPTFLTRFRVSCLLRNFLKAIKLSMIETNPITNQINDLRERTDSLRGYL